MKRGPRITQGSTSQCFQKVSSLRGEPTVSLVPSLSRTNLPMSLVPSLHPSPRAHPRSARSRMSRRV